VSSGYFEFPMMGKVRKPSDSECYAPSSEPFRFYNCLKFEEAALILVTAMGTSTQQNKETNKNNKLRGLISRANFTDRATIACRRS
jgi:hypothetical protein